MGAPHGPYGRSLSAESRQFGEEDRQPTPAKSMICGLCRPTMLVAYRHPRHTGRVCGAGAALRPTFKSPLGKFRLDQPTMFKSKKNYTATGNRSFEYEI